jgi:hypothetical protein
LIVLINRTDPDYGVNGVVSTRGNATGEQEKLTSRESCVLDVVQVVLDAGDGSERSVSQE